VNLPYEGATSGERAMQDIQKILRGFGVNTFGHMVDFDKGELLVQRRYQVPARVLLMPMNVLIYEAAQNA